MLRVSVPALPAVWEVGGYGEAMSAMYNPGDGFDLLRGGHASNRDAGCLLMSGYDVQMQIFLTRFLNFD